MGNRSCSMAVFPFKAKNSYLSKNASDTVPSTEATLYNKNKKESSYPSRKNEIVLRV